MITTPSDPAGPDHRSADPSRQGRPAGGITRRGPWPVWVHLILAVVLVALLRAFVVQSFYVPSGSMIPTLLVGDRMVVLKVGTDIHRGDVVVFDGTATFGGYPGPRLTGTIGSILTKVAKVGGVDLDERDYIKRVIGMPGDHVVCCDARGRMSVNDVVLQEPYLEDGLPASSSPFDVTVPAGRMWMMGDNRNNSADSRAHLGDPGGGMVPVADVVGRPALRYWPLDRFGTLAGDATLAAIPVRATP